MWPLNMTIGGAYWLIVLIITFGTLNNTYGYHIAVDSQSTFNYNGRTVRITYDMRCDVRMHSVFFFFAI